MIPQFLEKAKWPYVGKIRSYFPGLGGGAAGGTGTLIHPKIILTAGHVVYDPHQGDYPTHIDVELGSVRRTTVSSTIYRTTQTWVTTDSQTLSPVSAYDIGAILLNDPVAPSDALPVPYQVASSANPGATQVNIVGFPIDPNIYGGYGSLYGAAALPALPYPQYGNFRTFYPVSTYDGMSGGPVYTREADGQIVLRAVHSGLYEGWGSGLKIYSALDALIRGWIAEVGG